MKFKLIMENWRRNVLEEARIDKIKKQYADVLDSRWIDNLSAGDPSGNDAYLSWMAKQVAKFNRSVEDVIKVAQDFHEKRQRLDKKDINQWKFDDLRDTLEAMGASKSKLKASEKEKGTVKIYEDKKYILLSPLTTQSSCIYGAGTQWCISATDSDNYFDEYAKDKRVTFVFVINKTLAETDPEYKIALVYYERQQMKDLADLVADPEELMFNPQEVYDSTDELQCKIYLSDRAANQIFNAGHALPAEYTTDEIRSCGKYLEHYFDGMWAKKYQKIIFDVLPEVRNKLDGIGEDAKNEMTQILTEVAVIASHLVPDLAGTARTEAGLNAKQIFKNFEISSAAAGYGIGEVHNIKRESRILRRLGLTEWDDGEHPPGTIFTPNILLKNQIDLGKYGLKQPEFTTFELLCVSKLWDTWEPEKCIAWAQQILEGWGDDPKAMEAVMTAVQIGLRDNYYRVLKNVIERGITSSVQKLTNDGVARDFRDMRIDAEQSNVTFHILLRGDYDVDRFLLDFQTAKFVDENFSTLMKKVKAGVLHAQEDGISSIHDLLRELNPDRKYWFLEPI